MNEFKIGDRVEKNNGTMFSNGSKTVTVDRCDGRYVWFNETETRLRDDQIKLATQPRPHAELACKYFMDDRVRVDYRSGAGEWELVAHPCFVHTVEYREHVEKSALDVEIRELELKLSKLKAKRGNT